MLLDKEDRASYGDEYNLLISGVYYWSEKTTVRPQFDYLWVFEEVVWILSSAPAAEPRKVEFARVSNTWSFAFTRRRPE